MRSNWLPVGLAICGAGLVAVAVKEWFINRDEWLFAALAAAVGSLAMGIACERRQNRQLWTENQDLKHQADELRDALLTARKESSELRFEAAQARRDSEALYHSLVDHLPLAVLRKDSNFKYTFVNRRYLEFSGKEAGDVIGQTDFDLFPRELATKYREGDDQVFAKGTLFEDIETYCKPDGEERYIQVLKTPVRDAQQCIIGTQVMFWDVTDRQLSAKNIERFTHELERRNDALRESESNLQRQTGILMSILNSMADGVIVADENERFVLWNPAADRIIGLGPMDKPTASWPQVYGLYESDRKTPFPADRLPITRAMRGEAVADVEMFVRNESRSDGVMISVNAAPLTDLEGQIKGGVVVFRDVTQQKNAEAEIRSKNQDLETLLYVTSHDLREPLRAIENFSRIVYDRYAEKIDAKGQDFLQRVVRGAQRLDQLIEDVLTLSRVQRTAQPSEDIDSGEIVADVLRHLETRIHETKAVVAVSDGLPSIRADRRWATQAMQNLVANALKYTIEGQCPEVEIGGFRGPEGVGLIVRDR